MTVLLVPFGEMVGTLVELFLWVCLFRELHHFQAAGSRRCLLYYLYPIFYQYCLYLSDRLYLLWQRCPHYSEFEVLRVSSRGCMVPNCRWGGGRPEYWGGKHFKPHSRHLYGARLSTLPLAPIPLGSTHGRSSHHPQK